MARRRHLKAVLDNYLSSLTSRYSDHEGYWALGFMATGPEPLDIDLLGRQPESSASPDEAFVHRAITLFQDQVRKGGLASSVVDGRLAVSKSALTSAVWLNGRQRPSREMTFTVSAVTDLGRAYESEQIHRVAPHDPVLEHRSSSSGVVSDPPGI